MKKILITSIAVLSAQTAFAGGLDRSGQPIGVLFEEGRYAEFSLALINPDLTGTDVAAFGGNTTGNVAKNYNQIGAGYKADINDALSYALIFDQPYGALVEYDATSVALGGTQADASSSAITALARYKIGNGFSLHGGLRYQSIKANVTLSGAAFGGISGYNVNMDSGTGLGYVVGAAYERPEIAMRVALTYSSEIDHDLNTAESIAPGSTSTTTITSPASINLDFQTGIAEDTLLFGSVRQANWNGFEVAPQTFTAATGGPLVSYSADTHTMSLGVGRKLSEQWSAAVTLGYERAGNPLVSPLGPSTGKKSVGLGATYTDGNMKVTGGLQYILPGNGQAETGTPDTARADFNDNSALAFGMKVGFQL